MYKDNTYSINYDSEKLEITYQPLKSIKALPSDAVIKNHVLGIIS